jgi:hypothetical protein
VIASSNRGFTIPEPTRRPGQLLPSLTQDQVGKGSVRSFAEFGYIAGGAETIPN